MHAFARAACRVYQKAMHLAMYLLPWREPVILPALDALPDALAETGVRKPLIITDQGMVSSGLLDRLFAALGDGAYAVFDGVVPNPTIDNIEAARAQYLAEGCDGLIALGGGSPMDCAKAVGARIVRPHKPIEAMRGQLKVLRRLPPLAAIPTTAGTGSEVTLAAVVTNAQTKQKYAINDISLIPRYAVLDPALTEGLPPALTAATGMDALTHAIEAFIGHSTTRATRQNSLEAIRLIDAHLLAAYADGHNMEARRGMQAAAYQAGLAFTRSYVGYVHAIAHQLGALYGTPHGLANAILLPHVLAYYGAAAEAPLARMADAFGIVDNGQGTAWLAHAVIDKIRDMNRQMNIPDKVADVKRADIPRVAQGAAREANPLYPVPRILDEQALAALVASVMGDG